MICFSSTFYAIFLCFTLFLSSPVESRNFPTGRRPDYYSLGNFHYVPLASVVDTPKRIQPFNFPPRLASLNEHLRLLFKENMSLNSIKPGPRGIHQALYWATALDAIQCLIANDYKSFLRRMSSSQNQQNLYSKLFYFARLRPRLLFAVGALLRALQVCTPLARILDPSIGVGAGINFCSMLAGSRWVKPLVLGWAVTKPAWQWLGGKPVKRAYVPITLSIREWEESTPSTKK